MIHFSLRKDSYYLPVLVSSPCFFIMNVDYWVWRDWSKMLLIICFVLLVLVLIPGIGMVRNGSRSWIGVGAFSIQPSEFMKLAMIAFLAKYLSEHQKKNDVV